MSEFLTFQMDYIYFVYGLAFILLAAICATMREDDQPRPAWMWLGLFGLCHGFHEWLEMIVLAGVYNPFPAGIQFTASILLMLSFVFLLEFGRASWRTPGGKNLGRWVVAPLLICAISGGFAGSSGLNAATRFALGLIGGLWSAATLLRSSIVKKCGRTALALSAVAMTGYAIAAGAVVPEAPFTPAMAIGQDSFLRFTGIPIELVRAILAILIIAALWAYHENCWHAVREVLPAGGMHRGIQIGLTLAVVLTAGWIATELAGRHGDREMREIMQNNAALAAASLDQDDIVSLTLESPHSASPVKQEVRQQLVQMQNSHPQIRGLHLMRLDKDGQRITTIASSLHIEDGGAMEPDETSYEQMSLALLDTFAGMVTQPELHADKRGLLITAFAAVRNPSHGRIVAALAVDMDANQWRRDVAEYRLGPIVATLLVSILLIGFFVTREKALQATEQIGTSQKRLEEAQELAHVGSWTYSPLTGKVTWSKEMYRILGVQPGNIAPTIPGERSIFHSDDWQANDVAIQKAVKDGGAYELELRITRPDGFIRHLVSKAETKRESGGAVVRLVGTMQDITERVQMEQALKEARDLLEEKVESRTRQLKAAQSRLVMQEKMASMGQLAAGIAHEMSNPISFVAINFRTLQQDIEVFKKMIAAYRDTIASLDTSTSQHNARETLRRREESEGLDHVLDHIDKLFAESKEGFRRVMEIVTSMRDFSRMDDPSKFKLFNINKSVRDALIVGQNSYKYHAETETNLGKIPEIQCVPDLINRVLLNLVVNAAQAIEEQEKRETKGHIAISTWADADNVYCEVADDGPGIAPEIQTRVFEPFFTTKEIGKGTGLGLSLSYDTIVVKHCGDLTLSSAPGQGARFLIKLPIRRPEKPERDTARQDRAAPPQDETKD